MLNLRKVADDADMIVNGYAFNKCSHGYRVLNLNKPQNAIVFSKSGEISEIIHQRRPKSAFLIAQNYIPLNLFNPLNPRARKGVSFAP